MAVIETIVKFSDIFLFKYAENGIAKEYGMAWSIGFGYFFRKYIIDNGKDLNLSQQ